MRFTAHVEKAGIFVPHPCCLRREVDIRRGSTASSSNGRHTLGTSRRHSMPRLTPCGLVTVDLRSVILDVNDVLLEWMGSDRADVVGRSLESFLTLRMPLADAGDMRPTDATLHGASGIVRPVVVGSLSED